MGHDRVILGALRHTMIRKSLCQHVQPNMSSFRILHYPLKKQLHFQSSSVLVLGHQVGRAGYLFTIVRTKVDLYTVIHIYSTNN